MIQMDLYSSFGNMVDEEAIRATTVICLALIDGGERPPIITLLSYFLLSYFLTLLSYFRIADWLSEAAHPAFVKEDFGEDPIGNLANWRVETRRRNLSASATKTGISSLYCHCEGQEAPLVSPFPRRSSNLPSCHIHFSQYVWWPERTSIKVCVAMCNCIFVVYASAPSTSRRVTSILASICDDPDV